MKRTAQPPAERPGPAPGGRGLLLLALVALVVAVYANALGAPFHFDDFYRIVEAESVRGFRPLEGYPNRPLLTLTLALDHALFGPSPAAFRATNVALHAASALLLFGLARRTLLAPALAPTCARVSTPLAFAIAALWALHPVHTMAVTYVWQRGESMMGMFFLATLYCAARHAQGPRPRLWTALALAAFFAGLATKEVMVAAAPVLLLYDGVLLAPSFRAALRRRWPLYATLGATLLAGALFVLPRTHTSLGEVSRLRYALSQPGVVLDYLRLSVWPHPLSFDHGRAPAHGFVATVPPLLAVLALIAATLRGLAKRAWWGVAGGWFFLALAPTSSFVPINDLMVEYRLYLPLVPVVALLAVGGWRLCARLHTSPAIPLAAGLVALGALTVRRNHDYQSNLTLWRTVVETSPRNGRGHEMYGVWLGKAGDYAAAERHGRRAVELAPRSASARWNLGTTLAQLGRPEEALEQYRQALPLEPRRAERFAETAELELRVGQLARAARHFERALALDPGAARAWLGLADTRIGLERYEEAAAANQRALELAPREVEAWRQRARLAVLRGDAAQLVPALERVVELEPDDAYSQANLGLLRLRRGEPDAALRALDAAMRTDPTMVRELCAQARAAATAPGEERQRELAQRVCELGVARTQRRDAEVLAELARVLAARGRADQALALFQELLALPQVAADPARAHAYQAERDALVASGG